MRNPWAEARRTNSETISTTPKTLIAANTELSINLTSDFAKVRAKTVKRRQSKT